MPGHQIDADRNSEVHLECRVLQVNTNHTAAYHDYLIASDLFQQYDLILVQEPAWFQINGEWRTSFSPAWSPVYPCSNLGDRRPRVLAYVSRAAHHITVTHRPDIIDHPDVQVLSIAFQNCDPFFIANVYNQTPARGTHLPKAAAMLGHLLTDLPHLVCGDFNLHHGLWSGTAAEGEAAPEARDLVEWMEAHCFQLLNEVGRPTFFRGNSAYMLVLDLARANNHLVSTAVVEWAVEETLEMSDHAPISITVSPFAAEPAPAPLGRWASKSIKIEKFNLALEGQMPVL
jgi:hypothetical protein